MKPTFVACIHGDHLHRLHRQNDDTHGLKTAIFTACPVQYPANTILHGIRPRVSRVPCHPRYMSVHGYRSSVERYPSRTLIFGVWNHYRPCWFRMIPSLYPVSACKKIPNPTYPTKLLQGKKESFDVFVCMYGTCHKLLPFLSRTVHFLLHTSW